MHSSTNIAPILIFDNDAVFSTSAARTIEGFGIDLKRTAFRSPWQNGTAERFVGSVRRELLDHVVVLSEWHLRRLLREYVEYYNTERASTLRSPMRPLDDESKFHGAIAFLQSHSASRAWSHVE
jgi:hypothetical protein